MVSEARFRSSIAGLSVDPTLRKFVDQQLLPGTGVTTEAFWQGLGSIVKDLMPTNASLLLERDSLQRQVDEWHKANPAPYDEGAYTAFLKRIGYLAPEDKLDSFEIETRDVDAEISTSFGPQLVCPVDNTRFILNAANARWGSLLDALYATNVVPDLPGSATGPYDAARGAAVFDATHRLLDELFPLRAGSWAEVTSLRIANGALLMGFGPEGNNLWAEEAPAEVTLEDDSNFVGFARDSSSGISVVLQRNGLHLEILVDPTRADRGHKAGIVDVRVESAMSTICDFEDSACTVDAEDKVAAYSNWLGLMNRTLAVSFDKGSNKGGGATRRELQPARYRTSPITGEPVELKGQALLLARNVGMHMLTDMVTTSHSNEPVPEHFVDALVTAAAALHDVRGHRANSRHGSIYVVKPKMHGAEEAALAATLMGRVEQVLGLPANTIKIGVMDEERRTSVNLAQTMQTAKERLFFVNTGFLDRTADEIHTSMEAGPMLPKPAIKGAPWYSAYEEGNVATALHAALPGRGQIGKGMWAEPDNMRAMMAQKGQQIEAGASTGWVPSPIAATLHALHYMRRSVPVEQRTLLQQLDAHDATRRRALLTPPLLGDRLLDASEIQAELDNNTQGLLGYVVRWVGQGVGCSKVPDLHGVELMEDRATLRISSQHIANWLHHGVVSETQVMETLKRVAGLVDAQNGADPKYTPMAPTFDGPEWHAAIDLVFHGRDAPNGYTESTLSHWRRVRKSMEGQPAVAEKKATRATKRSAAPSWSDEQVYRRGDSMGGAM